jgi:hypothetical protein
MSASFSTAARVPMVAPAASKSASATEAPAPAPASTATLAPRPMNFLAVSGDAAIDRDAGAEADIFPGGFGRCRDPPLARFAFAEDCDLQAPAPLFIGPFEPPICG